VIRRKPLLCRLGLHVYRPAAAGRGPARPGQWLNIITKPQCVQCGRWKR
jgi:hypothetical protein